MGKPFKIWFNNHLCFGIFIYMIFLLSISSKHMPAPIRQQHPFFYVISMPGVGLRPEISWTWHVLLSNLGKAALKISEQ